MERNFNFVEENILKFKFDKKIEENNFSLSFEQN